MGHDMDETAKAEITERILKTVADLSPKATFRSMYGGTVIEMRAADPKTRVVGVFAYTKYVSVEFTKGIILDDPHKVLEGAGKVRRHIKLHSLNDIVTKDCRTLLKKALKSPV
jgi:hypothetical protein